MPIKAIILDMDGTFVNSEHVHEKAEHHVCKKYGIPLLPGEPSYWRGMRSKDIFRMLIKRYYKTGLTEERLQREKENYFMAFGRGHIKVYPGFWYFLHQFRPTYKLAVATSSTERLQRFIFKELKIGKIFDAVITGDHVRNGKPHPEEYTAAIHALGLKPKECVVIEDADNGIIAAKRAGARTIGVAQTLPRKRLLMADLVVNKLSDITPAVLKRLER